MLDLVFFSIIEVATAFAPNYTSFIILRALFGIGMGGEWGAGSSLVLEKVPARLRGLFGGLLMQGYSVGNLLAAMCYFTLFQRWGWRPMFLLGGIPALLAIFVRMRVKESGSVEGNAGARLDSFAAIHFLALETLPLHCAADDVHEFEFSWHAGYVPDLPATLLALRSTEARDHFGDCQRGSDLRRHSFSPGTPISAAAGEQSSPVCC